MKGMKSLKNAAFSSTYKTVWCAGPSIEFVHERLLAERNSGRAILLISSELDEVVGLADRIAVIYKGEILGIVDPSVSREKLGLMMAGVA